jgi:hypothetical protein
MFTVPDNNGNANQNYTKILPHSCENSYHQEHHQQQMLARMWENRTLIHCWWECKLVQPLWKRVWSFLKKLKVHLPYDLVVPLLGIYLKECESGYKKGTCTLISIVALFTVVKLWKHPRCPTIDKWIKKM